MDDHLGGGEGERLSPFIQRWLGHHRPKQFCTFVGSRSMLQHTLDLAGRLTQPERKVTVIVRSRSWEAWPPINFPFDRLQRAQDHIAVVELTGVLWNDWGRPERIADSLCRIGKQPAYPRRRLRGDPDMNQVEGEGRSVRGSKSLSVSFPMTAS